MVLARLWEVMQTTTRDSVRPSPPSVALSGGSSRCRTSTTTRNADGALQAERDRHRGVLRRVPSRARVGLSASGCARFTTELKLMASR